MLRSVAPRILKPALATLATLALVSHAACAVPVTFSGELSRTDNVFNRPSSTTTLSGFGTHTAYDVIRFQVSLDGRYSVETTAFAGRDADTYLALYQGGFDAAAPLDRLLQVNDDGGVGFLSLMSWALRPDTDYVLVLTSFSNGAFGAYRGRFDTVSGGGQVIVDGSEVPEPDAWALLPLAALSLVLARACSARRRSKGR